MSSSVRYVREKPVPQHKIKKVEKLKQLIEQYNNIILIDFQDIPSNMMKKIRKSLWGKGDLFVVKNTLAEIAIRSKAKDVKGIEKLVDYLEGMRAFVFTNQDIFQIARELSNMKEKLPPKPGKISPIDIILPQMNTGYKTGPLMTDFRLAGLPIKMIDGEIWIWEETHFVKKGERLSATKAKILDLLDISPFEVGPKVIVGFEKTTGDIIPGDLLIKPIEEYEEMITKAYTYIYNIAMNTMLPLKELAHQQVQLAVQQALNVSIGANILTDLTREMVISRAYIVAINVAKKVSEIDPNIFSSELKEILAKTESETTEKKAEVKEEEKEEKKEEKKEEEESIGGLAALFG